MAKIILSILFIIFINMGSRAQSIAHASIPGDISETSKSSNSINRESIIPKYTLESYGTQTASKPVFEEDHFLGNEITGKWNLFQQNYKRIYEQSVGLSGSIVEILKPVVFNAVNKINGYYKKALKNGKVSKEVAIGVLNHVLDCANLLCFENNTENVEADIRKAKSAEEIVEVFASIRINYH